MATPKEEEVPSFIEEVKEEPTASELKEISVLAERQIDLENQLAALQVQVDDIVSKIRHIEETALPDIMARVGMKTFTLTDGSSVQIKDMVFASIRADQMDPAVEWLNQKGFGGVIKDQISCNLGKGNTIKAKKILDFIEYLGIQGAEEKLSVHAQSLKSLIVEQRKKGLQFPETIFSIANIKKAIIERPKKP